MATRESERVWEEIEALLGSGLDPREQSFLRLEGLDDQWSAAIAGAERDGVAAQAARMVRSLRSAGLQTQRSDEASDYLGGVDDGLMADGRWQLWRDLSRERNKANDSPSQTAWVPLRLTRVLDLRSRPLACERIEVSVDSRIALSQLHKELDRVWKLLREDGWAKRTRPLGERALSLLRFVCLDSHLDASWRQRLDAWNNAYPDLAFKDVRAFLSAFRRAERDLTGSDYGLAWYYDRDVHDLDYRDMTSCEAAEPWAMSASLRNQSATKAIWAQVAALSDFRHWTHGHQLVHAIEVERSAAAFDQDPDFHSWMAEYLEDEGWDDDELPNAALGGWRIDA